VAGGRFIRHLQVASIPAGWGNYENQRKNHYTTYDRESRSVQNTVSMMETIAESITIALFSHSISDIFCHSIELLGDPALSNLKPGN